MRKAFNIAIVLMFVLMGMVQDVWAQEQKTVASFDGTKIAYIVEGQGSPALVFIHGWSCDKSYWEEQIEAFSRTHKVIAIDLAGHGDSSQNRNDYTMVSFGQDVKAVIDQESIDDVVLIGHSMGGSVIAEAALLMPDKVIALIGADTLHNIARPLTQEDMDGMLTPLQENFIEGTKVFVKSMFPEDADPKLVEWVLSDMSSAPKNVAMSAMKNYLELYRDGGNATLFKKIDVPVFAINARLWPTDVAENRKHMKSFDVSYIEDSGHFVMQENPEGFNKSLRAVLEKLNGNKSWISSGPKVIIITGTASGFGKAAAERLIAKGHIVYGGDVDKKGNKYLDKIGGTALVMDVRNDKQVKAGIKRILKEQGRIDVLINNAGYGEYATIENIAIDDLKNQFDVNVFGYARLQQAVLPVMRKQRFGRIILVSSGLGKFSFPGLGWYAASKHAVEGMADALRLEVKRFNIDVVKIQPGASNTNFVKTAYERLDQSYVPQDYTQMIADFRTGLDELMAKAGGPEETADAIVEAAEAAVPEIAYVTMEDAKYFIEKRNSMTEKEFYDMFLEK